MESIAYCFRAPHAMLHQDRQQMMVSIRPMVVVVVSWVYRSNWS